jgi:hypothetical protein
MNKIPVSIISFNRPHYLSVVLTSIKKQKLVDLNNYAFYLYQDGYLEDGKEIADGALINECIEVFSYIFPEGVVYSQKENIGVALNFARAEKNSFEVFNSEYAYFFEDDMEFSPYYFKKMEDLAELAIARDDIGYFAAYGLHFSSMQEQIQNCSSLITLNQNWGFGLTKYMWLKMQTYTSQYIDLIKNVPYKKRDHSSIKKLLHSWGVGCPDTSQDSVKTIACALSGGIKINTYPCYARYIGQDGMNFDSSRFVSDGYSRTIVFEEYLPIKYMDHPKDIFDKIKLDLICYCFRDSLGKFDGSISDSEDVYSIYKFLFNRKPENESIVDHYTAMKTDKVLEDLFFSPEFIYRNLDKLERLSRLLNYIK